MNMGIMFFLSKNVFLICYFKAKGIKYFFLSFSIYFTFYLNYCIDFTKLRII